MPICMETGDEEFKLQVPEISTFIPVGETGEEESLEIGMDDISFGNAGESTFDAAEEPASFGEIELESPFETSTGTLSVMSKKVWRMCPRQIMCSLL